ncbi:MULTISPECIES: hypothetical protein [Streptomyces]|uniref:Uncharacterized protein n=1 Tax=Streptomyces ehimensis TaxID=68195 RepID=A0ABV9BUU3_9ACTN
MIAGNRASVWSGVPVAGAGPALTVLMEPAMLALRRLTQEHESARRNV